MKFKHTPPIPFPVLREHYDQRGRFYITPEGNIYPSVTTVLSHGQDNSWKQKWIERQGEDNAAIITHKAVRRGTAVHKIIELYLDNDPSYLEKQMPVHKQTFRSVQKLLDDNVGLIVAQEVPLYSDRLRTAGRVDCIARWNGVWSVIDFKTSRKPKTTERVFGYMCQEACYATMFSERYNFAIDQIVTVVAVDNDQPQVFVESAANFIGHFEQIRSKVDF